MDKQKKLVWDTLSTDIQNVDFKTFRETHGITWLTKERKLVHIEDMETNHIISAINMLERSEQEYTRAYQGLTLELKRRYLNTGHRQ